MFVTTWARYGVIICKALARSYNDNKPMASRAIAESEQLPADYTEQILLRLRRAGVVNSLRGAKGGYILAKSPAEISLLAIFSAFEPDNFTVPSDTDPRVLPVMARLQTTVCTALAAVTLLDAINSVYEAEMMAEAQPQQGE